MKKNPQGCRRVNGDYLLTGKLFCGKCKNPMTGISGTSKTGDKHYYYVCQKRRTENRMSSPKAPCGCRWTLHGWMGLRIALKRKFV